MSTAASFLLPPAQSIARRASRADAPVSDVRLFHTDDGGDVELIGGLLTLSDGLETAVYLSLFGGNERDSGLSGDDALQWWGNLSETESERRYRSETQHLLRSLPAVPASLRRIEDAVKQDLGWLTRELASQAAASASIPRLNTVQINVEVTLKSGTKHTFAFTTSWRPRT